jgi:hypothetical protein
MGSDVQPSNAGSTAIAEGPGNGDGSLGILWGRGSAIHTQAAEKSNVWASQQGMQKGGAGRGSQQRPTRGRRARGGHTALHTHPLSRVLTPDVVAASHNTSR